MTLKQLVNVVGIMILNLDKTGVMRVDIAESCFILGLIDCGLMTGVVYSLSHKSETPFCCTYTPNWRHIIRNKLCQVTCVDISIQLVEYDFDTIVGR